MTPWLDLLSRGRRHQKRVSFSALFNPRVPGLILPCCGLFPVDHGGLLCLQCIHAAKLCLSCHWVGQVLPQSILPATYSCAHIGSIAASTVWRPNSGHHIESQLLVGGLDKTVWQRRACHIEHRLPRRSCRNVCPEYQC